MSVDAIDTTAEEMPAHDDVPVSSTSVVRRERRSEVIRPLDASALVDSFKAYQDLLPQLLDASDYQGAGWDKKLGRERKFIKKSGWRKIATAFDLDVQIVRSSVERDDQGHPVRAEVWARAIAPSGRSMDGDGYCSVDEERFLDAKGRQKLENDLRATATTRAMNRAISGLVGMGEVSAEEVSASDINQQMPAWTAPASEHLAAVVQQALAFFLGDSAGEVFEKLKADTDGALVAAVGRAVVMTASAIKNAQEAQA